MCMNFVKGPTIPPPTMKELMNNVHMVKTFELGIQLDLDLSDINTAMADHKNDACGQLIKILSLSIFNRHWIDRGSMWPRLWREQVCSCLHFNIMFV